MKKHFILINTKNDKEFIYDILDFSNEELLLANSKKAEKEIGSVFWVTCFNEKEELIRIKSSEISYIRNKVL